MNTNFIKRLNEITSLNERISDINVSGEADVNAVGVRAWARSWDVYIRDDDTIAATYVHVAGCTVHIF